MKKKDVEQTLDFCFEPAPGAPKRADLMLVARDGSSLSAAQVEFNKLMKRLENERAKQQQEKNRLDSLVTTCITKLMPLVNQLHRLNFNMVDHIIQNMKTTKFTQRRREALEDLLMDKAGELIEDPSGLSEEEVNHLRSVIEKQNEGLPEPTIEDKAEAFNFMRDMMQDLAGQVGLDIDFSDIDWHEDPAEIERKVMERINAAQAEAKDRTAPAQTPVRKPTKAQLEREKRQQEAAEVKQRDLKSLYKQLAKVLHPDLEIDPARKHQKEEWMKRLTSAHSSGDLRELLCIEMEWLGEEATNLTSASDEKLKVYCAVLKEQIKEIKQQTTHLHLDPRYSALDRFRHPFTGFVSPPHYLLEDLHSEIDRHEHMLSVLRTGGKECQRMLNRWADDEARAAAKDLAIFG